MEVGMAVRLWALCESFPTGGCFAVQVKRPHLYSVETREYDGGRPLWLVM